MSENETDVLKTVGRSEAGRFALFVSVFWQCLNVEAQTFLTVQGEPARFGMSGPLKWIQHEC
jgi:hypothetical protein